MNEEELKTLNDITFCTCFRNELGLQKCNHCKLQIEAIKWLKDAKKHKHDLTNEDWEDFFNITEKKLEELKKKEKKE